VTVLRKARKMMEDGALIERCYVKRFIIDCRDSDGG